MTLQLHFDIVLHSSNRLRQLTCIQFSNSFSDFTKCQVRSVFLIFRMYPQNVLSWSLFLLASFARRRTCPEPFLLSTLQHSLWKSSLSFSPKAFLVLSFPTSVLYYPSAWPPSLREHSLYIIHCLDFPWRMTAALVERILSSKTWSGVVNCKSSHDYTFLYMPRAFKAAEASLPRMGNKLRKTRGLNVLCNQNSIHICQSYSFLYPQLLAQRKFSGACGTEQVALWLEQLWQEPNQRTLHSRKCHRPLDSIGLQISHQLFRE